jgi:hypothetical protein
MTPTKGQPVIGKMTGGNRADGRIQKHNHSSTPQPQTQEAISHPAQVRSVVMPFWVPDVLATQPRWVTWARAFRDDGIAKILKNARTGGNAKSNTPSTWSSLDDALDAYNKYPARLSGIGYNFKGVTDVVGIDLDKCIDEGGNLLPWAAEIVSSFDTYTEVSPSGRGVRMFGLGRKPGDRERGKALPGVELYDGSSTRYLTVTGNHLPGTPTDVVDVTQPLTELYQRMFGAAEPAAAPPRTPPAQPVSLDDAELLARAIAAKNGARFAALWQGDTSAHSSRSEADYALVGALLFWTAGDVARVDRLFRSSGLMRDKWDARRGASTYGALTIAHCASGQTQFYTPPQPRPANVTAAGEVIAPPTVQDLWRILHEHVKLDGPRCKDCGGLTPWEKDTAKDTRGGYQCFRCKRRGCMDWQNYRAKQLIVQQEPHTWAAHYITKLPVADYDRMVDRGLLRDLVQWFAVLEQDDVVLVASSEALNSLSIATRLDALAPTMAQAWLARKPGSRLRDPKKAARAKRETIACDSAKPAPVVATVDDEPVIAKRKAAFGLIDLNPIDAHTLLDIIAAEGGTVDYKRRKWSYPAELRPQIRERVAQWRDVAGLGGRLEINTFQNQPTGKVTISSTPLCEQPDWANMTAEQQEYARLTVHRDANHDSIEREVNRM